MYDSHSWSMSSDSELTSSSANRHHHRPHSSQSRVYHAHPAPRSSQASSRNLLHYSDSTSATYLAAGSDPADSAGLADSNSGSLGANASGVSLSQTNLAPATSLSVVRSTLQHLQGDGGLLAAGSQHNHHHHHHQQPATADLAAQNLAAYRQQQQAYSPHQASISSVVSTPATAGSYDNLYNQTSSAAAAIMQQQQQQQQQQLQLQQQQQQALTRQSTAVGLRRQLPSRPLKQSMSIDHTSRSPYHQQHNIPQQQQQPVFVSQALHSSLVDPYQTYGSPLASSAIGLTSQRPLSSPSEPALDPIYKQQQRNFRLEMDMIEKQVTQMSLNPGGQQQQQPSMAFLHHQLPQPPTSQLQQNHHQQLQHSAVVGSSSLEQLQAAKQDQPPQAHQYLTNEQIFQQQQMILQQQHQRQKHHQQQLTSYGSLSSSVTAHHQASSPARQALPLQRGANEWLPPSGASAHHVPPGASGGGGSSSSWAPTTSSQTPTPLSSGGANHLKQTMSVDQYQPTRGHYAHVRESRLAEQQHYHRGSSRLADGNQLPMGAPLDQLDYGCQSEQVPQAFAVQPLPDDLNQGPRSSQQQQALYVQQQQQQQQQHVEFSPSKQPRQYMQGQQQLASGVASSAGSNYGPSANARAASASSKLQHQMSSSSSNSQSGSLKSSNLDLSKTSNEQLRTGSLSQLQQHHHQTASLHRQQRELQQQQQQQLHQQDSQMIKLNNHSQPLKKGYTILGTTSSDLQPADHQAATAGSQGRPSSRGANVRAQSPSGATFEQQPQQHSSSSTTTSGQQASAARHQQSRDLASSGSRSESSTGLPKSASNSSSLTKKSNSTTQLSTTGTKKRLGFRRKEVTSFSVHRSEEVAPLEARHLVKQNSSVSEGESSMSGDSSSRSWSNLNFKQPTSDELASMSFIDGLGKGQMISRQGLASPYLGDIQLSLCDRRGNLEIEVIRARNLQAKTNKILPLTYVKLYLVKNRKCLAKAKTTLSNKRSLDPLFQQTLTFHEDYHGCILQSIIWGNFGKIDKKNFMGIAQISLDDLELSATVISWYKLFLPSSLQTLPSKSLRHTLLSNSTESFTNTNNS